jgi:hypothetical protein
VVIGMDQHKRSVTIELMGPDETVLAGGRYATDHLTVLEQALSRLPDRWRDKPILSLADGAGYSHALIPARCSFKAPSSRSGFRSSTRPRRDPARPEVGVAEREQRRRRLARARRRHGHHRPARPVPLEQQLPWDASDRPPDAAAPRSDAGRLQVRDGFRYQAFTTNTGHGRSRSGKPGSCARPGRGPDPDQQGHRPGTPAVPTPEQ